MRILDLSAGHRAIWFNKRHPYAVYLDIRPEVSPDVVADSRALPPTIGTDFDLIVFDPPHVNFGATAELSKQYGHHTTDEIRDIISRTAQEAHRVSKPNALLALKWNDHDQRLARILALMAQW